MLSGADTAKQPLVAANGTLNLADVLSQFPGTGQQADPNKPPVYMGFQGDHEAQIPGGGKVLSNDAAKQSFFGWPMAEQTAWANKMYRAGLIDDPGNYDAAFAQWSSAVDFAGGQYAYGQKHVTPWDVMQQRLGLSKLAGNGNGPKTTTSRSTTTDVITNGDADTMVTAMFQQQLGRDPSDGEKARYRSMLINKSKASPQTTTTTQTVDANGNSTSNSTTAGGFSSTAANGLLQQKTQADPEYGAYQAATTYMGALQQLMSGSPQLVGK